MLEQAKLVLHGRVTEESLWGSVLLLLSVGTAAIPMFAAASQYDALLSWVVGVAVFSPAWLVAGYGWGKVLDGVRKRWFVNE